MLLEPTHPPTTRHRKKASSRSETETRPASSPGKQSEGAKGHRQRAQPNVLQDVARPRMSPQRDQRQRVFGGAPRLRMGRKKNVNRKKINHCSERPTADVVESTPPRETGRGRHVHVDEADGPM